MAYKLLAMAEERWRKLNAAELLAQVRAGVKFVDGVREGREIKGKERKEGRLIMRGQSTTLDSSSDDRLGALAHHVHAHASALGPLSARTRHQPECIRKALLAVRWSRCDHAAAEAACWFS
jgi:hypothetical protein